MDEMQKESHHWNRSLTDKRATKENLHGLSKQVNRKCDEFFRKRGMLRGKEYSRKSLDNLFNKPQHKK